MVTCPHALASAAGVDVLRAGGSAVDAAIATSAALAVIYPHMTGIGGDAFWLIHDAKTGKVHYLNGGGRAAKSASIDFFTARDLKEIPFRGILPASLTTPGSVDSWCKAHANWGRLPLSRNLQQAIAYAHNGFPVTGRLAGWIARTEAELRAQPDAAAIFLANGVPATGALIRNAGLARTLEAIGREGRAGFYEGAVAKALAGYVQQHGGFFTEDDLHAQEARWGEPLVGQYRDLTLYQTPAPTQGFTVLEMLNLVEPLDLRKTGFLGPDHVHLLVQAKQIAYHDRDRYLADPDFANVPLDRLTSKAYANERRALIDPAHPNCLAPGKIPVHTLIASMGKRNDKLWSVLGCMGADGQPQIQLQAYVAMMDFGCDIQQALEAPRWLSGRFGIGEARDTLHIEGRFSEETLRTLDARGHQLNRWGAWNELAGHAHGIVIDPITGVRYGGSDPRSDGAAIGY
jgi:gamma-glutamyltranspeptidase/glutathione hydrolase